MPRMVRFRADPTKVRVSIRLDRAFVMRPTWTVTIQERPNGLYTVWSDADPVQAVESCLAAAKTCRLRGIDVAAKGVYPHPQS